jgi:valyl-tRNA synthetase
VNLTADPGIEKPKASVSAVIKGCEIFIPLEGLIDLDIERGRLKKEIERMESSLTGINKKLSNEKFVRNAAPEVVEKERSKKLDWELSLNKLKEILINLG